MSFPRIYPAMRDEDAPMRDIDIEFDIFPFDIICHCKFTL
jgi:hypothetical protein